MLGSFTLAGMAIGGIFGGWLIPDHGCRVLIYVAALPIILAIMMHYLVPEPAAWQENRFKKVENQLRQLILHGNLFSKIRKTVTCSFHGH